jgi:tetratricopeptide (TPR) repeat protein
MVLIRATVRRAIKIERFLPTNLTLFIHKYVKRTQIDSHIIFLYILFIFASVIPSFVTVFTNDFPDTLSKVIFFIVCLSILIGFIGWIIYYNSKSILDINIDLQAEKNKLAKKYEDDGDEDRAIKCYEENVEENYEAYDHFDRLAKIYKKKRDKVNQIRVLKRAIWVYENIVFKYHIDREKILKEFEKRLKRVNLES